MSRRRSFRQADGVGATTESALQGALDELCVALGFCLGPEERAKLCADPPSGVDAFVDAVMRADGMDPTYVDSAMRRRMREIVQGAAGELL